MKVLGTRYNEERYKVYILEFDVQYQENLNNLHYELLSLPEIELYRIIISCLKIYLQSSINMNTDLKKYTFKKDFSELVNNASFGKTIENVKKYQLVRTKKGKTY